ncbi:MAG: hypothetical protein HYV16_07470 [Gammaproteobacteria bacterium]|nr:hypothetical protein [Gammaproteobacteria bacterium]
MKTATLFLLVGLMFGLPACAATKTEPSYASPGKPSAPVTLSHEWLGTPQLGQPITLRLNFRTRGEATDLRVHYAGEGALSLRAGAEESISLRAEPMPVRELTVIPSREGRHYVNVFVELGGRARAYSIPLQVGKVDMKTLLKPQGKLVQTPEGQSLISLPAEETVEPPK